MQKRRGQNQGSVYQRSSDKRWVGQITIQKKHRMKYFYSQSEAEAWLRQALLRIGQGMPIAGTPVSLVVYFTSWLENMAPSLRPKTWIQYEQVVNKHILPSLGHLSVQELKANQIQEFYRLKLQAGTGHRTLTLINCILHHALEDAVANGFIFRNPVREIPKLRQPYHEQRVLRIDQVKEFLQVCRGTRWEAIFCLAITTGMRVGELLGLRWMDIDWERGQLQVLRQLQRIPRQGLIFSEPKTASSRRCIALGREMLVKLRVHAVFQQQEKCFAGENWRENNLVFPTRIGTPMDPHRLMDSYKHLLKQAGLPDCRLHDLRHTAATLMLGWGIHPKVVQERLGHARISHTLGTYSHVLPSIQEEAADKMDKLILRTGKKESASKPMQENIG
jgi:integrase